jgi:hypothetical protein
MTQEPAKVLTLLLLVAFVMDRFASAFVFLLSRPGLEAASAESAARRRWNLSLFYFAIVAGLAALVLYRTRLVPPLGLESVPAELDLIVRFIALVGGAERISSLLGKGAGDAAAKAPAGEPVEVRGTLTVVDRSAPAAGR